MQVSPRQRLSPAERREQILDAATRELGEQGYLPLSVGRLARRVGTSSGLIYYYFPSQQDLCHALLERAFGRLLERLDAVQTPDPFRRYAADAALTYFDCVVEQGNVLQTMLSDPFMTPQVDTEVAHTRGALWRHFCRLARRELGLTARESLIAVATIAAIPEELGALAHRQEIQADRARTLCERLVLSCVDGLAEL